MTKSSPIRNVLAGLLGLLWVIALFGSVVGTWAHRQVSDADTWAETVRPLATDEDVIKALEMVFTRQIMDIARAKIIERIPDRTPEVAVNAADQTAERFVRQGVQSALGSDRFEPLWVATNRVAHQEITDLIKGERSGARGSEIRLNLLPAFAMTLRGLDRVSPGLISDDPVPDITRRTPRLRAIAELSTYLGVELPADFGSILIADTEHLATTRQIVSISFRAYYGFRAATAVLGLAILALARPLRFGLVILGAAGAISMGISLIMQSSALNQLGAIGTSSVNSAALRSTGRIIMVDLRSLTTQTLTVAVLVCVTGLVLSSLGRPKKSARRAGAG